MKYILPMIFITIEFTGACIILYQCGGLLWKIFIALCDSVIKLIKRFVKYVVDSIKK